MAQVHPFTNPFFKSPSFDNAAYNTTNPFTPYQTFLGFNTKHNPWNFTQLSSQNWFAVQQKFWQDYIELVTWQQRTLQQNMVDSAQAMMHCMQLSAKPTHLFRYIRRNWQKPYVTLGAQTMNASRLYTKFMTDSLYTWQKTFSSHQPH